MLNVNNIFKILLICILTTSLFGFDKKRFNLKGVYLGMDIYTAKKIIDGSMTIHNVLFNTNDGDLKESNTILHYWLTKGDISIYSDHNGIIFDINKVKFYGTKVNKELIIKQLFEKYGKPTIFLERSSDVIEMCWGDCHKGKNIGLGWNLLEVNLGVFVRLDIDSNSRLIIDIKDKMLKKKQEAWIKKTQKEELKKYNKARQIQINKASKVDL